MHHLTMACWGFNLEIDDAVPVAHPLLPSTTPFLLGSTPFLTTRETIERLVTAVVVVVKASLPSQTKPSTPRRSTWSTAAMVSYWPGSSSFLIHMVKSSSRKGSIKDCIETPNTFNEKGIA